MWSVSTILAGVTALFWLVNLKSFPTFWHFRFYNSLFKHLYFYKPSKAVASDVFHTRVYTTRSPAMECDLNLHKSNSTYFSDLDIARTDLIAGLFHKWINDVKRKENRWPYVALAGVVSLFRREIKPYSKFNIKSRVIGWDEKWIFVLSRFETPKGKLIATCVSKYVFKLGRKTVPPKDVLDHCGMWNDEVENKGNDGRKRVQGIIDLDQLDEVDF
ncbi:hypothetical protein V1514DRAFT_324836 [Lipomyces japonicus]|uniref:uncharacterized protein n=1 Tax=Lipomyces japonicus TaxID=56871 RepID=UPI0034CEC072